MPRPQNPNKLNSLPRLSKAEAARRNGAKSQGPATRDGKLRSARNAIKHGLCAEQTVLLDAESDENYMNLKRQYFSIYRPMDIAEAEFVTNLVNAQWLLRRTERHQSDLYDSTIAWHQQEWIEHTQNLDNSLAPSYAFFYYATHYPAMTAQLSRNQSKYLRQIQQSLRVLNLHRKTLAAAPACDFDYDEILQTTPANPPV